MGQRTVRVVVGQGDLEQTGSLRRMLERDQFAVVGDATNASQLARVLTDEQPDVVVLDDVIGISAVELAAEIAPQARLIVVWPAAVMPIAGAVRVDPADVATTLTATVALVAGLSGIGAIDRPEWVERVKKDPATLREMLAARSALPARPSVTELQRRGHRLHPSPTAAKHAARDDAAAAAVVPIGLAASRQDGPSDTAEAPDTADAAAVGVPPAVLSAAWNRRLGIIALGGAAAAGALMIAIALGPHSPNIVSAEPFPVTIEPAGGPPFVVGDGGSTQNHSGLDGNGGGGSTTTGGSPGGNGAGGSTTTGGSSSPHGSLGGLVAGTGSSSGGGSGGAGGSGGSSGPGGGSTGGPSFNSSHLPGAHGTGKPGTPGWKNTSPGGSDHNPHGGPPGHGSDHQQAHGSGNGGEAGGNGGSGGGSTSHGNGAGATEGHGATHGNSAGHSQAGTHGNGHANGHATRAHGNSAAHRHKH